MYKQHIKMYSIFVSPNGTVIFGYLDQEPTKENKRTCFEIMVNVLRYFADFSPAEGTKRQVDTTIFKLLN